MLANRNYANGARAGALASLLAGAAGYGSSYMYGAYNGYSASRAGRIANRMRNRDKRWGKKRKLRLGKIHSISYVAVAGDFINNATGIKSQLLTNIDVGDVYNQRLSNNILSKSINFYGSFHNDHTNDRIIRMVVVQLRGSSDSADVTNWTDLLVSNGFTKTAVGAGTSTSNVVYKINQDEYKVLLDRKYVIRASGDDNDTKIIKWRLPTKKIVKFEYNSSDTRRGAMFFVMFYGETANSASSANKIEFTYRIDHNYVDVDSL